MIDPFTASKLAIEGISTCIEAAKLVKKTIENIKHVKQDLLELANEIERHWSVLGLVKVLTQELLRTKFKAMELAIDTSQLRGTLEMLRKVANSVAETGQSSGQLLAGIHWSLKKSEAEKLVLRLRDDRKHLMDVVGLINATASLRSLQELEKMKAKAVNDPPPTDAFADLTLSDKAPSGRILHTWLGQVNMEAFTDHYFVARSQLADAAYYGNWDVVFEMLEHGRQMYQENWVNAYRIRPLSQHSELTGWTLLHQAALWKAPPEIIQRLLDQGAYRTLRTRYSEFSYADQTPLEIAHDQGDADDITTDLLTPVIRSPLPSSVLYRLQRNFHDLIHRDLGARVEQEHFFLPVLETLTELRGKTVWFEVRNHRFGKAGYWYRLDGRDLLVRSQSIAAADTVKEYRVTAEEVEEVQDATVIHERARDDRR